jgi:hypothetical protein
MSTARRQDGIIPKSGPATERRILKIGVTLHSLTRYSLHRCTLYFAVEGTTTNRRGLAPTSVFQFPVVDAADDEGVGDANGGFAVFIAPLYEAPRTALAWLGSVDPVG